MVDFRLRRGVEVRSPQWENFVPYKFSYKMGLGYHHHDTMCFDVPGIYRLLILPRQLRNPEKGLYKPAKVGDELITIWSAGEVNKDQAAPKDSAYRHFIRSIDLGLVIGDNFGVDVVWQPYEYKSWVVDFVTHTVNLGLGFIPEIGPLISVSFSIGLQAITDPDMFKAENILKLSASVIAAIVGSSMAMQDNLPKGFQGGGKAITFAK